MPSHLNGYDSTNAIDLNNIDFRIDSRKKSIDSDSDVSTQNTSNQIQPQSNSNNSKEAIVIRNTGYTDRDNKQELNSNSNNSPECQSHLGPNRGSGSESVNIEIRVTVNTTPNNTYNSGTLADLKKQRAEKHRNSLTHSSSSDSTVNRMIESGRNSITNVPTNAFNSISAKCSYDSPPSPTTNIRKFKGNPSDIVGESRKKGCFGCTIS
jgi:hypothetical protein